MSQFIDYGSSADGAVSSANGTINTFATCTGTSGAQTVTTALTVAAGDYILLHQSKGTGAGNWEVVKVNSTGSGEFTADRNLTNSYVSGAQAVKMPQYSGGTCSNSLTTTAWNGSVGGILALVVNGDYTHSGSISVAASGFRGGAGIQGSSGANSQGSQGEGETGTGSASASANGIGGGAGETNQGPQGWGGQSGGGGGYGTAGTIGGSGTGITSRGAGGGTIGTTALTTLFFGGGGGAGGGDNEANPDTGRGGNGGIGGGIVFIIAKSFTLTGTISSNGQNGEAGQGSAGTNPHTSGGGGGAGGSILIKAQTITLGTNLATATAGSGGGAPFDGGTGGAGGVGRIHADYLNTVSGSTNPTIDSTQDLTLADIIANLIYGFFI